MNKYTATLYLPNRYCWEKYLDQHDLIKELAVNEGCIEWGERIYNAEERTCQIFTIYEDLTHIANAVKKAEEFLISKNLREVLVNLTDVTALEKLKEVKLEIQEIKSCVERVA